MKADAVVVGAGIAGIAAAHDLAVKRGLEVVIVDSRPPLTLTSDKSTECYRNWWPNQPMVGLMNRSIDLLEEYAQASSNVFSLSRRGYLFVTSRPEMVKQWIAEAHSISGFGAGPVRLHPGGVEYEPPSADGVVETIDGADIFTTSVEVQRRFPYLTQDAVGALHIRRAGWFSAQQLGSWMLERSRDAGALLIPELVTGIATSDGHVARVITDTHEIESAIVIDAAGPMAAEVAAMVGVELPLKSELHLKVGYRDHRNVVPRDAPMLIWSDPQRLDWSTEERTALEEMGRHDLLGEMPIYCHGRPEGAEGSQHFLALWEYHGEVRDPTWPLPADDLYPEVVAKGLSTMIPEFETYLDGLPESTVDGGYYMKTEENRPLVGPAGPPGFYLACGYSGFGVMVACGAADLLGRHVTGDAVPSYSPAFLLDRYQDPDYIATIRGGVASGQL